MFRRLLVPLDGSRLAEAVLPAASALAAGLGAGVALLHVVERAAPEFVHGEPHLTKPDDAEAYLRAVAHRMAEAGVEAGVAVEREGEDVAQTIAAHAEVLGADLIVLCTHGRGGLRGLLFGRVAQQVLARGTTPVLLISPSAPGGFSCRRILVPLDATEQSEAALPVASALARAFQADLLLIAVVPTVMTVRGERAAAATLLPTTAAALLEAEADRAHTYLDGLRAGLVADGVTALTQVTRGDPVETVIAAVARHHADMIVMATHGRGGLAAVWTGSVAARLLPHALVPVLLVRASKTSPAG